MGVVDLGRSHSCCLV